MARQAFPRGMIRTAAYMTAAQARRFIQRASMTMVIRFLPVSLPSVKPRAAGR